MVWASLFSSGGGGALYKAYRQYLPGRAIEADVVEIEAETRSHPSKDETRTWHCPVVTFTMPDRSTSHRQKLECASIRAMVPAVGTSVTMTIRAGLPSSASRGTPFQEIKEPFVVGLIFLVVGLAMVSFARFNDDW